MNKIRPAAVPLVTVDPYFSIWSFGDNLYDDATKHWTGRLNPILAGVLVDGTFYGMAGVNQDMVMPKWRTNQTDLTVTPLSTEYVFENQFAKVTLTFTTPLLADRLDILTRTASYVKYKIERKCSEDKKFSFIFGICARACVDNKDQMVKFGKTDYSIYCGNVEQKPLNKSGDNACIDWGYLHLLDPDAKVVKCEDVFFVRDLDMDKEYNAYSDMPYMAIETEKTEGVITLAYDEVKAIEYFGKQVDEYYTKYFASFRDMALAAQNEYEEIKALCDKFDEELMNEAGALGEDYKTIATLAWRQTLSGHKLIEDENGKIVYLSKECDSNGCIGTLDITYPSMPLYLKYNPELVKGMLRPIIKYSYTDDWKFDFTPHDVGQYPLANGQVYGMTKGIEEQMPVEECGNMMLCLAAVYKYSNGDKELFDENAPLMKKWADYLVEYGYDPGSQLCTDDFAGHLDHNCNLSAKAILGIAAYSMLSGDESYMKIAKEYAEKWEKDAKASHGATRLTFDNPDGWSMKYNMAWDNLLGFNIFSKEVKAKEVEHYLSKLERYGTPLDSRDIYTKLDWIMWATCIDENKEFFDASCRAIVNMMNETTDRFPMVDWYTADTAFCCRFRARTVVGGVFINLL